MEFTPFEFQERMRERWRISSEKFAEGLQVGQRVQLSVDFLRNTGQVASNNPRAHSTGTVVSLSGRLASVQWDCDPPNEPTLVNAFNLGYPTTPRTCGGL